MNNDFERYEEDEILFVYGCIDKDFYVKDEEMPLDWHLAQ